MKQSDLFYLVKADAEDQLMKNPRILRILMGNEYIQIDFGYVAPWI